MKLISSFLLLAMGWSVFAASEARADNGRLVLGSEWPWFADGYSMLYRLGRVPVPPYYALHPPVYYSAPQPFPYGCTPFARRPSRCGKVEPCRPQPRVLLNPHIDQQPKDEAKETSQPAVAAPRFIVNPHYSPKNHAKLAKLAETDSAP